MQRANILKKEVEKSEADFHWFDFIYRNFISPLKPPCCRYIPTCSEYALIAVEKYGVVHGGWMAIKRILRCHPFHKGGYDPVKQMFIYGYSLVI